VSDYKIIEVYEQEATFDGKFSMTIDGYLLMKIINHAGAESTEEAEEFDNPKRMAVRVVIETRELPTIEESEGE
jgi:hypothetical protein